MGGNSSLEARLVEFRDLGPDVRHFVFEIPAIDQLRFRPGQFVSLSDEVAGKKVTRAYSVASAPDGNRFELCLNRVNLGRFSPYLFSLRPGGSISLTGPLGTFMLRDPVGDSVFIATGTGIAPFRSMFRDQRIWEAGKQYTLLLGVRYEEGILYRDEFEEMERRWPNFRFWPVLSRPAGAWTGRRGHVQAHLLEAVGDRRDVDVYICGLKAMVDDVRRRLKDLGFDRHRLIYEKYD